MCGGRNQVRRFSSTVAACQCSFRNGKINGINGERLFQNAFSVNVRNRKLCVGGTLYLDRTGRRDISRIGIGNNERKILSEDRLQFFGNRAHLICRACKNGNFTIGNGSNILFRSFGIADARIHQINFGKICRNLGGSKINAIFHLGDIILDFLKCHFVGKSVQRTGNRITDFTLSSQFLKIIIDIIQLVGRRVREAIFLECIRRIKLQRKISAFFNDILISRAVRGRLNVIDSQLIFIIEIENTFAFKIDITCNIRLQIFHFIGFQIQVIHFGANHCFAHIRSIQNVIYIFVSRFEFIISGNKKFRIELIQSVSQICVLHRVFQLCLQI